MIINRYGHYLMFAAAMVLVLAMAGFLPASAAPAEGEPAALLINPGLYIRLNPSPLILISTGSW